MFFRFAYEAEFYPTLSRLPLHVRMKLDLTGVKISLKDWLAFSFEERTVLCHLPIDTVEERTAFRHYLDFLSRSHRREPVARTEPMDRLLWNQSEVPEAVMQKSGADSREVMLSEWRRWQSHQRYALYKTAISKNQPGAFEQILDELRNPKN
jgi:hypothetical protein